MTAASAAHENRHSAQTIDTTLLELVWSVSEVTTRDHEVVAVVSELLRSGAARLCGNFRDCPIELLLEHPGDSSGVVRCPRERPSLQTSRCGDRRARREPPGRPRPTPETARQLASRSRIPPASHCSPGEEQPTPSFRARHPFGKDASPRASRAPSQWLRRSDCAVAHSSHRHDLCIAVDTQPGSSPAFSPCAGGALAAIGDEK